MEVNIIIFKMRRMCLFVGYIILTGQVYLSPHALSEMWKEEGERAEELEKKFEDHLASVGVSGIIRKEWA